MQSIITHDADIDAESLLISIRVETQSFNIDLGLCNEEIFFDYLKTADPFILIIQLCMYLVVWQIRRLNIKLIKIDINFSDHSIRNYST